MIPEEPSPRFVQVFDLTSPVRVHRVALPADSCYTLAFIGPATRPRSAYDFTSPKIVLGRQRCDRPRMWSAVNMWTVVAQCYLPLAYALTLQIFVLTKLWYRVVNDGIAADAIHTCL